jgi:hypothetical protein
VPQRCSERFLLAPQARAQLLPASTVFSSTGRNAAKRAQKPQTMLASISRYNHTRISGKAKERYGYQDAGRL